jgi:Cu(I)/Ag(I) efflux system membrane fusion protein
MKPIKCLSVLAFASVVKAQHYNYKLDDPFIATRTIKADGLCVMYQHRIERVIKNLPGVWFVNWNIDAGTVLVKYDKIKTGPDKIQQAIVSAGHDTDKFKAPDDLYNRLPDRCHYRGKS